MRISLLFIPVLFFVNTVLFAQIADTASLNNNKNSVPDTSLSAASRYFAISETSKAFIELKKAQAIYQKANNKKGQMSVFAAFAGYYDKNELWPEAERYYQKALSLIEESDSTGISADIAFSLAKTLYSQGKYEEALHYCSHALERYKGLVLKSRMAECYVLMAQIKNAQKNYKQAETFIMKQALPLFRSAGNEYGRISCFDALGHMYHEQKRYSEAKWYFIQANTQSRNLKDTAGIINSLIELGKVKIDIHDYDLAIRDFKEADLLAKQNNILSLMAEVKKACGILYKQTGNKKASSSYMGAYAMLSDSLTEIQNNKLILAKKAENDAETFIRLASETKKPSIKKSDNDIYIYFLLGFVVLISILTALLYLIRKNKLKRS